MPTFVPSHHSYGAASHTGPDVDLEASTSSALDPAALADLSGGEGGGRGGEDGGNRDGRQGDRDGGRQRNQDDSRQRNRGNGKKVEGRKSGSKKSQDASTDASMEVSPVAETSSSLSPVLLGGGLLLVGGLGYYFYFKRG